MNAKANGVPEAQIQGGSSITPLCDSDVLDPNTNLKKSQEQTGVAWAARLSPSITLQLTDMLWDSKINTVATANLI